jgi:hypothetical protein
MFVNQGCPNEKFDRICRYGESQYEIHGTSGLVSATNSVSGSTI